MPNLRKAVVDFSRVLRTWDGFGVNYVETHQTRDYDNHPQDYGGFSLLSEENRQRIAELTFGDDGLRPGVVKMFLDPFHQPEPDEGYVLNDPRIDDAAYDHERTTRWMRDFVRRGLALTRARGGDLEVLVCMYGPAAWLTKQKFVRGRDLDPALKVECAKYMVSWAKFLREREGLSVRHISLHNEGEDWHRWPEDGSDAGKPNHDHNMWWTPELVAEFVKLVPEVIAANGLEDLGVTPGETSNWTRFSQWGYADAIADDPEAVAALGLITSHGFYSVSARGMWHSDWRSVGIDTLRALRPDLHAWVTSTSWSKMDPWFVDEIRHSVYAAKVNAIIPWACIQTPGDWLGGDPNPGTAFRVAADGSGFDVEPGYYYYKQVCCAGQPGTGVARVRTNDGDVELLAFACNGTRHPDAFVVINLSDREKPVDITVAGTGGTRFAARRTSEAGERYADAGAFAVLDGVLAYAPPPRSVTTFTLES